MARIPVFLSISNPFQEAQIDFLQTVEERLRSFDLEPQTLGRNAYTMDAPLKGIRDLMSHSYGLISLAFRRTLVRESTEKPNTNNQSQRNNYWLTSSYCHIESAMAYQLNLPILIWREEGVLEEGVLDRGALGIFMPQFDLSNTGPNFTSSEWANPLDQWTRRVKSAYENNVPTKY